MLLYLNFVIPSMCSPTPCYHLKSATWNPMLDCVEKQGYSSKNISMGSLPNSRWSGNESFSYHISIRLSLRSVFLFYLSGAFLLKAIIYKQNCKRAAICKISYIHLNFSNPYCPSPLHLHLAFTTAIQTFHSKIFLYQKLTFF